VGFVRERLVDGEVLVEKRVVEQIGAGMRIEIGEATHLHGKKALPRTWIMKSEEERESAHNPPQRKRLPKYLLYE
jgi:hypothetical protein